MLLGALVLALVSTAIPVRHASALTEAQKAEQERLKEEKAQRKKDNTFNREIQYRHSVGPNVLAIGPFTIALYVRGNLLEGRVHVAIQAKTPEDKSALEAEKSALMGIIYPLAVRMYETGRPSTEIILNFKRDVLDQLRKRFAKRVDDFFIIQVI